MGSDFPGGQIPLVVFFRAAQLSLAAPLLTPVADEAEMVDVDDEFEFKDEEELDR